MSAGLDVYKPTDWWRVDQLVVMNCPGIRPRDIDELTLSEITLIISDPHEPRPFQGRGCNMSDEDIDAGLSLWRGMKPREKLEWIRANH